MPAKKAAPQQAQSGSMGMDAVWKWLYFLGMLVAGVAGGLGFTNNILTWVLLLLAVVLGWFYFDAEEVEHFGLRVVILFIVKEGLSLVPVIGSFITGFFGGWLFFLFPVVLAMVVHFFWDRRVATLF